MCRLTGENHSQLFHLSFILLFYIMFTNHISHTFASVPRAELPRSQFDRSYSHKLTMNAGYLVPAFFDEVLPGDTFNLRVNMFARLASPLTVPIMDDMFIDMQFFYVPCRILWDNWKKFQGEQRNPGDSTDYLIPEAEVFLNPADYSYGGLADAFGIPPAPWLAQGNYALVNALPFRAYNLIWNEWYRDQNLQIRAPEFYGDGPDSATLSDNPYVLRPRGKRHDYFTSCLPWPQKGPGVEISLGQYAPLIDIDPSIPLEYKVYGPTGLSAPNALLQGHTAGSADVENLHLARSTITNPSGTLFMGSPQLEGRYFADLSSATPITINSLRQAVQLQRLLERDARGGTRYTEVLRSHFGVVAPDASLQRPEYLGGFTRPIVVNPVSQTSSSDEGTPQANQAAWCAVGAVESGFVKSFTEHGYVFGLVSIRANLTYQQGLNRLWSRRTRFDFYMPVLAHLGEQAVLNKEIYYQCNDDDNKAFGYQERFAEYRYHPSQISGLFRSTAPQSLDIWHLSQKFDTLPTLSDQFIRENPPIARVSAVSPAVSGAGFLADFWFQLKTARVMPTYSVPGLMDHF